MKIDIIVAYIPRYELGHEKNFVPPITGIHLAALFSQRHAVRVFHQQVDTIDMDSEADVIAISFFSGFAQEAFRLASAFKRRGKIVIGGGPHATFSAQESLAWFDAIVIGEAESVWRDLLDDIEQGSFQRMYTGIPTDLSHLPTPRYDLLSDKFFIKKVIQATRGCPYSCAFCTVPVMNPGLRKRPIEDVIRDMSYEAFGHWWQRKVVWFWDDNLTIDRQYSKALLTAMKPLRKWWLTQASVDIAQDEELLTLMKDSGCIGIFLGLESFDKQSLRDAGKTQNSVSRYKQAVNALHARGIAVMAGFISGFDHDTCDSVVGMARNLMKLGIDVPFLSIMTPFIGTEIHARLSRENRMLPQRNWNHYNGYNVTFFPKNMSANELLKAHRTLWREAFSFKNSLIRILRSLAYLRRGAFCLTLLMNGLYCLKKLRKNYPMDMAKPPSRTLPLQPPCRRRPCLW